MATVCSSKLITTAFTNCRLWRKGPTITTFLLAGNASVMHRPHMRLASIREDFWELRSAEKSHEENPESFWIPSLEKRSSLSRGDAARIILDIECEEESGEITVIGERMYAIVARKVGEIYIGILDSQPASIDPKEENIYLGFGVEVPFKAEHIIDINRPPDDYIEWQLGQEPERRWYG